MLYYWTFQVVVISKCCNGSQKRCFQVDSKDICYFQPSGTSTKGSWGNASEVCKKSNSTLPVIENERIQKTLEGYLREHNASLPETWIAGREIRTNQWWWLNGKSTTHRSKLYMKNLRSNFLSTYFISGVHMFL